jgi:hypothetical protein
MQIRPSLDAKISKVLLRITDQGNAAVKNAKQTKERVEGHIIHIFHANYPLKIYKLGNNFHRRLTALSFL